MRFRHLNELATLPWFDLNQEGRLRVSDPEVGSIIDVHTHLALNYGRRGRVDLLESSGPTQHYLSTDGPFNLEVYANVNIPPAGRRRMKRDLTLGSLQAGGMRASHTAPNLLREMRELGVISSLLLPIDFPVGSHNAQDYLALAAQEPGLISLGSIHPLARHLEEKLDRQQARGARGIKVHPAVQLVAPSARRALHLYRLCGQRRLPVLFHCGPVGIEPLLGRRLSQVRLYRRAIEECPNTTFVLGHSGALQMEEALRLAQQHENVYLEISCQALSNVRRILAEGPPERLLFGSDWPFYHQALPLAKVLIATSDDPEMRRRVLRDNARRLFGLGKGTG